MQRHLLCGVVFVCLVSIATSYDTSTFNGDIEGEGTYYGGNMDGGTCSLVAFRPSWLHMYKGWTRVALDKPLFGNSDGCGMCLSFHLADKYSDAQVGSGAHSGPIWNGNSRVKQIYAFVDNLLPEGKKGDLDIGETGDGRWKIQWHSVACPVGGGNMLIRIHEKNPWHLKFQIRNHQYPIEKAEFWDKKQNKYFSVPRKNYNYFEGTPPTMPFDDSDGICFKITDSFKDVACGCVSGWSPGSDQNTGIQVGMRGGSCKDGSKTTSGGSTPNPKPAPKPSPKPSPQPNPKPAPQPTTGGSGSWSMTIKQSDEWWLQIAAKSPHGVKGVYVANVPYGQCNRSPTRKSLKLESWGEWTTSPESLNGCYYISIQDSKGEVKVYAAGKGSCTVRNNVGCSRSMDANCNNKLLQQLYEVSDKLRATAAAALKVSYSSNDQYAFSGQWMATNQYSSSYPILKKQTCKSKSTSQTSLFMKRSGSTWKVVANSPGSNSALLSLSGSKGGVVYDLHHGKKFASGGHARSVTSTAPSGGKMNSHMVEDANGTVSFQYEELNSKSSPSFITIFLGACVGLATVGIVVLAVFIVKAKREASDYEEMQATAEQELM